VKRALDSRYFVGDVSMETKQVNGSMILGLRTAIYPASNLSTAKQWYAQVLDQQPYVDEPFYVGFQVGGFELGLIPDAQAATSGAQPLWGVVDIAAAYARLLELGAKPLEPVTEVGGGIKVAAVVDPFGNRFGIIENPHFDPGSVR
jgi:predicted enzyme related to lactoylglutathione lyase